MPNTNNFQDGKNDFAELGIPESLLLLACSRVKNIEFREWFHNCSVYCTFRSKYNFPFLSTDWQLALLTQDADEINRIVNDPTILNLHGLEMILILLLAHPTLAVQIIEKNTTLLSLTTAEKMNLCHCAAAFGNLDLVKIISELCPSLLNEKNIFNNTTLNFMCLSGNLAGIDYLLKNEPQLNVCNIQGIHILHQATLSGVVAAFDFINENTNLLMVNNIDNLNCAHFAALSGNLEMMRRVKELVPSAFDATDGKVTILTCAARSTNPLSMTNLYQIVPCDLTYDVIYEALLDAAFEGTLEAAQYLINLIEVNFTQQWKVLRIAVRSGRPQILRELMTHFPNCIYESSPESPSLLYFAALSGNPTSFRLLLELLRFQFLDMSDDMKRAMIYNACLSGNPLLLDLVLQEIDFMLLQTDQLKNDLLTATIKSQNSLAIKNVISKLPNWVPNRSLLPLLIINGDVAAFDIVTKLLPGILDYPESHTILFTQAIEKNNLVFIEMLHRNNQHLIRRVDSNGWNAFHFAARGGNVAMVERILLLAPDLALVTAKDGRSAAYISLNNRNSDVLSYLLKKVPGLSGLKVQSKLNILQYAMDNGITQHLACLITHNPFWLQELLDNQIDIENFAEAFHDKKALQEVIDLLPDLLHIKGSSDCGILHFVAESGKIDAIEMILEQVPDQLYLIDKKEYTLLHHIVLSQNKETVVYFLKKYSRLAKLGSPILHFVIRQGLVEMMDLFLDCVEPQLDMVVPPKSTSILTNAAESGVPQMFNDMLQLRPSFLSVVSKTGMSYLHYAANSNQHEAMIEYLLGHFPYESSNWWQKDTVLQQTPDEIIKKRGAQPSASVILTRLIRTAFKNIVENNEAELSAAVELIDAYKDRLFQLLCEFELFSTSEIQRLLNSKLLSDTLGFVRYKQLSLALTLKQAQLQITNQALTTLFVQQLLKAARGLVNTHNTSIFISKSQLCKDLITFINILACYVDLIFLNQDQILTLSVIIHDYQAKGVNSITRVTDNLLVQALEASSSLQALKPQPLSQIPRNITPDTFLMHLGHCRAAIPEMDEKIKADVEKVFNGIEHIIKNKNAITLHVLNRYGQPYDVAPNLPIHTNHAPKDKPGECYVALQRLVVEFFAAFYQALDAGHILKFCEKISTGHCLEDVLREPLEWVAQLSAIQSFEELMHHYYQEYAAYHKVMLRFTEEQLGDVDKMHAFICKRHEGFLCKHDAKYAPAGVINAYSVMNYLRENFSEDFKSPAKIARKV